MYMYYSVECISIIILPLLSLSRVGRRKGDYTVGLRLGLHRTDLVRGDCAQRVGGGAGACVGGGAGACVEALRPLVEELTELERVHSYLAWIKRINQLWSVIVVKVIG